MKPMNNNKENTIPEDQKEFLEELRMEVIKR